MALAVTHSTAADGTFSPAGSTAWNAAHSLAGTASIAQGGTNSGTALTNGQVIVSSGGAIVEAGAGFTWNGTNVATTGSISVGAVGAAHVLQSVSGNSSYLSRTADGLGSNLLALGYVALGTGLSVNTGFSNAAQGNRVIAIQYSAAIGSAPTAALANNGAFGWTSSATEAYGALDTSIGRGGANSVVFSGANPNSAPATSRTEINKSITAIADNVAKATFTVTIPNGAHSAGGRFTLVGSLGAGGAIGANEASGTVEYEWVVTRTAGVNAVVTLSAAVANPTASVAGAAVMTITAAASAIAGAVGATNTFTLDVTIHAVTGSSTNHTCFANATLLNSNASGVTIA